MRCWLLVALLMTGVCSWPEVHVLLEERYTRASYEITVDGPHACEEARERLGELEFIRSRGDCSPVGE